MKTLFTLVLTIVVLSATTNLQAQDKLPAPSKKLIKVVEKQEKEQNKLLLKQNDDKFQVVDKQDSDRQVLEANLLKKEVALDKKHSRELEGLSAAQRKLVEARQEKEVAKLKKEANTMRSGLTKLDAKENALLKTKQDRETNSLKTLQDAKLRKEADKKNVRDNANAKRLAEGKPAIQPTKVKRIKDANGKTIKKVVKKPNGQKKVLAKKKVVKRKVRKRKGGR